MKKNDLIIQAKKEFLINKDYKKALQILNTIENKDFNAFNGTLALLFMESGEYTRAAELYKTLGENYNAGFCELLTGNEEETARLWNIAADSPACRWGRCVLDYIKLRRGPVPTYLQVRNHLETDMGYFIRANRLKYAENLMKCDDVFISVNLESYKLIGRVLLNFGFLNQARKYFFKSLGVVPNDAETFYYLARYNFRMGAHREAGENLEKCLEHNPNHVPARKLLQKEKPL